MLIQQAFNVVFWGVLLALPVLVVARMWVCRGPHKLPRALPWRLVRSAKVIERERPFLGWGRNWFGLPAFAFGNEEDSVAVVGPPRKSGKTAGVVIPQVLMWGGAVISTSTKPDVFRATAGRRQELARQHGGNVYIYAPTATGPVEGLQPIRWSPLAGCQDPATAALRVETLVSVAEVGKNVENADHWRSGAARILRAYFLAAANHPERAGDFAVVRSWLSLQEWREPAGILLGLGSPGGQQWAEDLVGIAERTNDKERASFFAAAATALKATAVPTVLESCSATDIDPVDFVRTRSTLYVVSPSEHQAAVAPLISALVESVVNATYELHRAGRLPTRLLLSLDELANIAPLPSLESIVSQGAGQGVNVAWVIQSLAQLRNRYGEHEADAIWSATTCKVVFGGLADGPSLDQLSRLIGDHRVATHSRSTGPDGRTNVSTSYEWRPRLSPAELRGLPPKWALLLYHHRKPHVLRAPIAAKRRRLRRAMQPWQGAAVAGGAISVSSLRPAVRPGAGVLPTLGRRLRVVQGAESRVANGADAER